MTRDNGGFDRADIDVALYDDAKVKRLARVIRDEQLTAVAVSLYVATVLGSWAEGERVTIDDATPAWWLGTVDGVRSALASVDLLDDEGRVPEPVWDSWFGPAVERSQRQRDRWKRYNDRRARGATTPDDDDDPPPNPDADTAPVPRGSDAVTARSRRGSDAVTSSLRRGDDVATASSIPSHTGPSQKGTTVLRAESHRLPATPDVTSGVPDDDAGSSSVTLTGRALRSWDTYGREWDGFTKAWLDRGLRMAPTGSADDDDGQRAVLYPILEARPADLARWVSEAPASARSGSDVIAYVIERWEEARVDGLTRGAMAEVEADATRIADRDDAARALRVIEANL